VVKERKQKFLECFAEGDHMDFKAFCEEHEIAGRTSGDKAEEITRRFGYTCGNNENGVYGVFIPDKHPSLGVTRYRIGAKRAVAMDNTSQLPDADMAEEEFKDLADTVLGDAAGADDEAPASVALSSLRHSSSGEGEPLSSAAEPPLCRKSPTVKVEVADEATSEVSWSSLGATSVLSSNWKTARSAKRKRLSKKDAEDEQIEAARVFLNKHENDMTADYQWNTRLRARDFDRLQGSLTSMASKTSMILSRQDAADLSQQLYEFAELLETRRVLFEQARNEPMVLASEDLDDDQWRIMRAIPFYLKAHVLQTVVFAILQRPTVDSIYPAIKMMQHQSRGQRLNTGLLDYKDNMDGFCKCQVALAHAIVEKAFKSLSLADFIALGSKLEECLPLAACSSDSAADAQHDDAMMIRKTGFSVDVFYEMAATRVFSEVHRTNGVEQHKIDQQVLAAMKKVLSGKAYFVVRFRSMFSIHGTSKENHAKAAWDIME